MDDISLALNPPKFVKCRRPPIRLAETLPRVWPLGSVNGRAPVVFDVATDHRGYHLHRDHR